MPAGRSRMIRSHACQRTAPCTAGIGPSGIDLLVDGKDREGCEAGLIA